MFKHLIPFLVFALLGLTGLVSCNRQEEPPTTSVQSGGELGNGPDLTAVERYGRYAKGFMDGLTFDAAGVNGQLTTMCTVGFTPPFGCTISCNFAAGFYTDATLTCNGDSGTSTGFATVSCPSDSFSQGFQGTNQIVITRVDANNVTLRIEIHGDLYLLKSDGSYSAEGIYTRWTDSILYFNKTNPGVYTYNCMFDSDISLDGISVGCAAANISNFSCI